MSTVQDTEEKKSIKGIVANIFPIFFKRKNKIGIFSMCCYRIPKEHHNKVAKKYVVINEKQHEVKMLFKRGIKLFTFKLHTYYFNIYKVNFDMDFLQTCPIQNLVRITFAYDGETVESPVAFNTIYLKYNWYNKFHIRI